MEKINSLLNARERCVKETRERLAKCGFDQEEIEDAIETALRVGLLSEERYARAYIRGKSHAGWGRLKILSHLRNDGIGDDLLDLCKDEFPSPQGEFESAMHELSKRSSNSSNPYASYMRRLVNKGYSYELSTRAVKAFLASSNS